MAGIDFPPRLCFDQWKEIRFVPVDLVCARKNEGSFLTIQAHPFQHIQRPVGVDIKVGKRFARCPIMGRLGGGMDNSRDILSKFLEQLQDLFAIPDIKCQVLITADRFFEMEPALQGRCFSPKSRLSDCCPLLLRPSLPARNVWLPPRRSVRLNR